MSDGVPTSIVEKLISNIVELTKQVTNMPYAISKSVEPDLDKVVSALTQIIEKMNTPPRHEELSTTLEEIKVLTNNISNLLKQTIRTIRIAAGMFSLAILIASIVIYFGTAYINSKYNGPDYIKINKHQVEEIIKDALKDIKP